MRLSSEQKSVIRSAAERFFGSDAEVYLFGSRLNDNAKGGDVDLLVVTPHSLEHPAMSAARLSAHLQRRLGGRKVDVLIQSPQLYTTEVHKIARQTGQRV